MKYLNWPMPALLAWSAAWLCFEVLKTIGLPEWVAMVLATFVGGALTAWVHTGMRRALETRVMKSL